MSSTGIIVLVVVAIIAVAGVAWSLMMRRRLKARLALAATAAADEDGRVDVVPQRAAARDDQPESAPIVAFRATDRERFRREWDRVQAAIADDPSDALNAADALVTRMMRVRGYSTDVGDGPTPTRSGEHATTVDLYRRAHHTFESNLRGAASPEQLRQAFAQYRTLATNLLDSGDDPTGGRPQE
jgi:hypothetical protein